MKYADGVVMDGQLRTTFLAANDGTLDSWPTMRAYNAALGGGDMTILKTFLVGVFIFPAAVLACSFDTDCRPGSKCAKAPGSLEGVCFGGISPGNKNDDRPVYSPLDVNRTYGNTCSFNTDCGPGSVCVKQGGIEGVCMKAR